jgi:hypothetical protein
MHLHDIALYIFLLIFLGLHLEADDFLIDFLAHVYLPCISRRGHSSTGGNHRSIIAAHGQGLKLAVIAFF